jgi:hypothetical protein
MNYTEVRHPKTGDVKRIPRHVLRNWKERGWVEASKPSPKPRQAVIELTPAETGSPESSNDTKENE